MLNLNKSVQILLDNKKITNISFNENEMNSFGYESLNEVFFDVFEIKGKNLEFIKEKKGDLNGDPIVELDLCIENQKYKNVRFVLKKNGNVNINPKLLDHLSATVFEQSNKENIQSIKNFSKKIILEKNTNPASRPASRPASQSNKTTEKSKIISEKSVLDKVKEEFYTSVKQDLTNSLKEEIKNGIISEMLKENLQTNFDTFIKQDDKSNKIYKLFEQTNNSFRKELMELIEKISKREAMRYAESGGGTNAAQYANGGVMNGDLEINGILTSKNTYINGNLTIFGDVSASGTIYNNDTTHNNNTINKFVSSFGNETDLIYNISHNLNSSDVLINIIDNNTKEVVYPTIINTNLNEVSIAFTDAPGLSVYKAIIIG